MKTIATHAIDTCATDLKPLKLRAPIRYFGGKGNLLPKLLPLIPRGGAPYVEPYMGAGSVFFAREPAPVEVLNDLDGDVVCLMRALQDRAQFEDLRHRLMYTPYARAEFVRAIELRADPAVTGVERAWAVFVSQNQGFGGLAGKSAGNWGRSFSSVMGVSDIVNTWLMRLSMLDAWRWRLMRAQIDNLDALEVIKYWDAPTAVIYCDPPYMQATRKSGGYTCETSNSHHAALVQLLLGAQGAVVLSGYDDPVYQPLLDAGWHITRINTACHAAGKIRGSGLQGAGTAQAKVPRVECVWRNPKAVALADAAST